MVAAAPVLEHNARAGHSIGSTTRRDWLLELSFYPSCTSNWNKIEYRRFRQITGSWRSVPRETFEVVVALIGSARIKERLGVHAGVGVKYFSFDYTKVRRFIMETGSLITLKAGFRGCLAHRCARYHVVVDGSESRSGASPRRISPSRYVVFDCDS